MHAAAPFCFRSNVILRKPGHLEEVEWAQMRRHPEIGATILTRAPFLVRAAVYAHRHHERGAGTQFDPDMAHAFLEGLRDGRILLPASTVLTRAS